MSESEGLRQEPEFAAFVGIDWADQKHASCVQAGVPLSLDDSLGNFTDRRTGNIAGSYGFRLQKLIVQNNVEK